MVYKGTMDAPPIIENPIDGFPLVLGSGSPRRRQLLENAGYVFDVLEPDPKVEYEFGREQSLTQATQYVRQLAFRKAQDVAKRLGRAVVIAADTVAQCQGQVLGKPNDREHAEQMLRLLAGSEHCVLTGMCVWQVPTQRCVIDVSVTRLIMESLDNASIQEYLDTGRWRGKAGGFGYQDGNDWLRIVEGSESNVVGLPMERLGEILSNFAQFSHPADVG